MKWHRIFQKMKTRTHRKMLGLHHRNSTIMKLFFPVRVHRKVRISTCNKITICNPKLNNTSNNQEQITEETTFSISKFKESHKQKFFLSKDNKYIKINIYIYTHTHTHTHTHIYICICMCVNEAPLNPGNAGKSSFWMLNSWF